MKTSKLTVLTVLLLLTVLQADADFALVVTGNVKDTAGQTPASAFTIRVRNEASGIEAESQTTADGTFKVVLFANVLADPDATVADAGDTLQITALNTAGEVVGAQSYQLTAEDLVNAVVPIDLEVDPAPVESNVVLAVIGNLRDTRGQAITERFTIRAGIAARNIEAESQTSLTGRYNVQLVSDESLGVGDTLELSAINAGGESLVSQTYQLTTADLANGFAIVNLTVQPIPSDAARSALVVVGTLTDDTGQPVEAGITVRVENTDRGVVSESQTTAEGVYKVILFADLLTDPKARVAEAGDTLQISATNASGETVATQTHQLTAGEVAAAVVEPELTLSATTPPDEIPTALVAISSPDANGQVTISTNAGTVAGESTVQAIFDDGTVIAATVNPDGSFTLRADTALLGTGFDIVAANLDDEVVASSRIAMPPSAGRIVVSTQDDQVTLRGGQDAVEPNGLITCIYADGSVATARANDDGSFTLTVSAEVTAEGFQLSVNDSSPIEISTVRPPIPPALIAISPPDADGQVTISAGAGAVPGESTVRAIFADGTVITAAAALDGSFTLRADTSLLGEGFELVAASPQGTVVASARISTVPPDAPTAGRIVVARTDALGNRTIRGGIGAVLPDGLIQCIYADGTVATARANPDGSFFLSVSAEVAAEGFELTVINAVGIESRAVQIATTLPEIPQTLIAISPPDADGQVTISAGAGAVAGESTVRAIFADGTVVAVAANPDGSFTLRADTSLLGVGFTLVAATPTGEAIASARISTGATTTPVLYVTGTAKHPDGSRVDGIAVAVINETTGVTLIDTTGLKAGNGHYVVKLADLEAGRAAAVGDIITVRATDLQGNTVTTARVITPTEFEAFTLVVDLPVTPPGVVAAPLAGLIVVSAADAEGNLTIRGAQGAVISNGVIRCTCPNGDAQTVSANPDGSFVLTLAADVAAEGFELIAIDTFGEESQPTRLSTTTPEIPRASLAIAEPDVSGRIAISAAPGVVAGGSFVRCIYADGSVLTLLTNSDGSFALTADAETIGIGFNLIVTDPAGNVLTTANIRTTVIVASPATIDFGNLNLFFSSETTATLSIRNITDMEVSITDITSTFGETLNVSETEFTLPADESQEVTLTWLPTQKAQVTGNLSIVTDYPDDLTTLVTLAGNAITIDVNSDGVVNIFDLVLVSSKFGESDPTTDTNNDGVVNIFDLTLIGANFGQEIAAAPSVTEVAAGLTLPKADIESIRQALASLEAIDSPEYGARVARQFLRAWLVALDPSVTETLLFANYPNPFNPETWIPYQLSESTNVTIEIYNAQGQLVREIDLGLQSTGRYTSKEKAAYWDGKNAFGEQVASGAYFYHFRASHYYETRKMVIVK